MSGLIWLPSSNYWLTVDQLFPLISYFRFKYHRVMHLRKSSFESCIFFNSSQKWFHLQHRREGYHSLQFWKTDIFKNKKYTHEHRYIDLNIANNTGCCIWGNQLLWNNLYYFLCHFWKYSVLRTYKTYHRLRFWSTN